jgi:hypothetical protein
MIPPLAAVLNRLLCHAWRTMLLAAVIATATELYGLEFGSN